MKTDQVSSGGAGEAMLSNDKTTVFSIPNMDCRNEEAAVRARLAQLRLIRSLSFDLPNRRLTVVHAFGEHPCGSPEAGSYFIGNQQRAKPLCQLLHFRQESWWLAHHSSGALHQRFNDYGGDFLMAFL